MMKRAASLALCLVALGVLGVPSCADPPSVKIVLLDPCADEGKSFREAAEYVEFVVYKDSCPTDPDLAAGKTGGSVYKGSAPADKNLPEVGPLEKGKYGFAALLRNENCGIIGFGCTEADMESIREVRIAVRAWTSPNALCTPLTGGGCEPPLSCVAGRCQEEDSQDCNLTVVAAGELPKPASATARLTGPAIVDTPKGFVLAYREQDAAGTKLTAVVAGLSDGGSLSKPAAFDLGGCAGVEMKDGVGIAFRGSSGLVATSLPNCGGTGAGAVFIPFDENGLPGNASGPKNATFNDLTMARKGGLAPGAATGDYELLYRVVLSAPEVQRVILTGKEFKQVPITQPFGTEDVPFAMVATSSSVRALLGSVPSKAGVVVQVGPNASDTLDVKGEFTLPDASWAGLTAWDDRVAALVPAASGVSWKAASLAGSTVSEIGSGTVGSGAVKGGGVVALRDHLLMLVATTSGMKVVRLSGAQGTLGASPIDTVDLPSTIGAVPLTNFDGEHVAIAAARSRVAIVWLTQSILTSGDPTGGWALLKCST